ncbi:Uncharacterized protein SCF082_LOCUS33351 [Durusdinium trenchii]|uniref:DUF6815 domain-containing protein n=1 Tax=Durusdinium trenchii TaxID=1381693 RepID=A0ABP0NMW2_9DINO
MRALQKKGKQVWPSPDVMTNMGAKDALCKIADLSIGLPDTLAYYSPEEFAAGFKKTMAFQPRVIKQNRGSSGEGIWIIKLKRLGLCTDDEVLEMMEACDNHSETHTVGEFIEFCVNGRNAKSGKWDTVGTGKYLEGGKAAGGQLVDQRFCPRIVEGEIRMNMIGDECTGIIHKKPKDRLTRVARLARRAAGGISAVGGTGSIYTFYAPDAPEFKQVSEDVRTASGDRAPRRSREKGLETLADFLKTSIPTLMESLELPGEPLPLWWTADFINSDPGKPGTPCTIDKWIVGEFNCSCVGISKCLPAYCNQDKPNASVFDIPVKDFVEASDDDDEKSSGPESSGLATYLGNLMGQKALAILDGQGAKMSPAASKILSRIEALRGASKAGVLSTEEASSMNALRALGLVLDAKFRSIFGKATHGRYEQDHGAQQYVDWHRFFDYIISSFPTLVWCSMLSVLLLHILELHLAWRRSSSRACLRPWFFLGNLLAYVLYAACVAVTLPRRYAAFRHGAYFLLGCTHVLLVSGLLYFGYAVKKKVHQLEGSDLLSRRMWLLALVPLTELVRTVNDFEYSLGFLPFNLDSGLSSFLFLALAKLFLEWLPSACILIVFQPSQRRHASPGARAEDLVNPLLPPKPFDQKPEVESSESEEDTRGTLGPPEGIPWSLRVTCGSPRCGLSEREWKAMGVDDSWICDVHFNDSSVDSSCLNRRVEG